MPQPIRSILAVLAGFVVKELIVSGFIALYFLIERLTSFYTTSFFREILFFFDVGAALVGGAVTAHLARRARVWHGAILALILFLFSFVPIPGHSFGRRTFSDALGLIVMSLAVIAGAKLMPLPLKTT
jgi:hypothetical protein